jgi:hypothetical protein
MSCSLLLDEMLSGAIAEELRSSGHDAVAVVADPTLVGLPDDQILAQATVTGRALATANIKDFMTLDAAYRAAGRSHAGLILISTKTFPQDRSFTTSVTKALSVFLGQTASPLPDQVLFLPRV